MNVESCRPQELSPADVTGWREAVAGSSPFASPFFHPEYVMALAEFRPYVQVAVVRRDGRPLGWLPFERHDRTGRPLGIKLADFQGAIIRPGESMSLLDVTSKLGLTAFHYDHLMAEQAPRSGCLETAGSPFLDLKDGYEAYVGRQRSAGDGLVSQVQRKQRKLLRDAKHIEFRWQDDDPLALDLLWKWKGAQRNLTGSIDILQFDWIRAALARIARTDRSGFHGIVSTLRINEEIAAVHLGMHTQTVFHYWFPAYSVKWAAYSPGLILLLRVAEACAQRGIERIDLGKGDDRYKSSFTSGSLALATGTIDRSAFRQLVRTSLNATKRWVKNSPLREFVRLPRRWWWRWHARTTMGTP